MRRRPARPAVTPLGFLLTLLATGPARADWAAGVEAFKAKSYTVAQREFEAAVKERPDWSGGHLMLGRSQLLAERVSEATATLRKAYDLDPSDLEIQLALSQAYLAGQRATEASQLLSKIAAASVPRERQALFAELQAKAAVETGQSERAAAALERVAAAKPQDAGAQAAAAVARLNAGDLAGAIAGLERSLRLEPSDPEAQRLLVRVLLRQGRESQGSAKDSAYRHAVEVARPLAQRAPSFEHHLLCGEAELGAGDYAAALGSFQRASAQNGADWLPFFYAGQAATALGDAATAETALREAERRATAPADAARVSRQLGFVYEKQADFERAKAAYRGAGDAAALARVEQNERNAEHNRSADAEAAKLAELKAQQDKLRRQLDAASPPPRP